MSVKENSMSYRGRGSGRGGRGTPRSGRGGYGRGRIPENYGPPEHVVGG